jgi:cytochrome c-type biogenesis protein CcmI
VIWLAAILIVGGIALFVAAPLTGGFLSPRRSSVAELELERREHERGLAVQGLRELEFDRQMGKLSDADYESLREGLQARALAAMAAIEKLRAAEEARPVSRPAARRSPMNPPAPAARRPETPAAALPTAPIRPGSGAGAARGVLFCPQCGARAAQKANFCAECGVALRPTGRAAGWSD